MERGGRAVGDARDGDEAVGVERDGGGGWEEVRGQTGAAAFERRLGAGFGCGWRAECGALLSRLGADCLPNAVGRDADGFVKAEGDVEWRPDRWRCSDGR